MAFQAGSTSTNDNHQPRFLSTAQIQQGTATLPKADVASHAEDASSFSAPQGAVMNSLGRKPQERIVCANENPGGVTDAPLATR